MSRIIRVIPRELLKHLEWTPGQEVPTPPQSTPTGVHASSSEHSLDDVIAGKIFYDDNMPVALQQAIDYAGMDGIVTCPEFISAKAMTNKDHAFWKNYYTVQTEENIGIDSKGLFYAKNEPVLVVVHGGGILTPTRIQQAYDEGLTSGSAKYNQETEFDPLLEGRLPDGTNIPLFPIEQIQSGISVPRHFGVVLPYSMAQGTTSGYHKKDGFVNNRLVLARTAGARDHLETYFDKAKDSDGDVGSFHPFTGRNPRVPQGRVLFVYDYYYGLGGCDNLGNSGRFVGVAPEARGAR